METSESHRSVTADEVIALNESVDTMKQELTALKSEVSQNRDKYVKVQVSRCPFTLTLFLC